MKSLDLNASTPEEVPDILRYAVEVFAESQIQLSAAWQDPHAGRIWADFALILGRAADQCDKALHKRGLAHSDSHNRALIDKAPAYPRLPDANE